MAHYYDNHDYHNYGRTGGHTDLASRYDNSGRTLGSYPARTRTTDEWVGDTWRKTDHDATYGRSSLSSYPHSTWTAHPNCKQPTGTTGRTFDRRGSFDEYVMKVATDYIKPSGPVSSSSSYGRSQNPSEYSDYFKKDFYKSNGYHPRSEHGSTLLGYSNNDMVRSSVGQYGAPMLDLTNNIGLAIDQLEKEATDSTAPSSQYGVHKTTQQYVNTVEPIVDPSSRYGNMTYFRRL